MYGCASWTIMMADRQRIDVFVLWCWRRLLGVPWTAKRSKPVNTKGNQSWIFIGRTDTEALILWPPDVRSQLSRKEPDAGTEWRQKNVTTEGKMVGWHHRLNGHASGQAPGDGEGQGSLACCNSWGRKDPDTTERLIWSDLIVIILLCIHISNHHVA